MEKKKRTHSRADCECIDLMFFCFCLLLIYHTICHLHYPELSLLLYTRICSLRAPQPSLLRPQQPRPERTLGSRAGPLPLVLADADHDTPLPEGLGRHGLGAPGRELCRPLPFLVACGYCGRPSSDGALGAALLRLGAHSGKGLTQMAASGCQVPPREEEAELHAQPPAAAQRLAPGAQRPRSAGHVGQAVKARRRWLRCAMARRRAVRAAL